MFQTVNRYFKSVNANDSNILSLKSKTLSNESIKSPTTSSKILNPSLDYVGTKARVEFNGDWLKQRKITFNHGKIVNTYIVYEIVDVDLYKYSGYGTGFDRKDLIHLMMKSVEMW